MSTWKREPQELSFGSAVGGVLGVAVGIYAGINLLIPIAFMFAAFAAGRRYMPEPRKTWLPPLAVQFGHLCWMLLGGIITIITSHIVPDIFVDVAVLGGGLVWLYLRPGLWPVIVLVLYHAICLIVLGKTALVSDQALYRALLVHALLRVLAIGALLKAYVQQRRAKDSMAAAAISSAFE